jgi:predicted tellurium resistance membrane protein TerC
MPAQGRILATFPGGAGSLVLAKKVTAMEHLLTFLMLTLLQAVLGFDNLLYISLESKRAPAERQAYVRRMGIGLAIGLRIVLLFLLTALVEFFKQPFFSTEWWLLSGTYTFHSLIVLFGGVFILYTAMKEILHMMGLEDLEHESKSSKSVGAVITLIVAMNLVFSFDSILSAMALTDNFYIMAAAIIFSGGLMIWLADHVSSFLQRNRMYEVLGLFILFVVGIMLLTEGGHLAHLHVCGQEITPMSKATFYFVIVVLVLTDIAQGRYQRRLNKLKQLRRLQLGAE